MFISLTVNDNDFTEIIEEFCRKNYAKFLVPSLEMYLSEEQLDITKERTEEEFREIYKRVSENYHLGKIILRIFHEPEKVSLDEKELYYNYIKALFYYLNPTAPKDLKIKIVKEIKDKWHNGEIVYCIPNDKAVITL